MDGECPVCFSAQATLVLSCDHTLCVPCATAASAIGINACPLCRRPHILSPDQLRSSSNKYRSAYNEWRKGSANGTKGEVSDVVSPKKSLDTTKVLHVSSAGDLALLGKLSAVPEEQMVLLHDAPKKLSRVLRRQDTASSRLGFAIIGMGRAGKIHLGVLGKRHDVQVRWLVDVHPEACPQVDGVEVTSDVASALNDPLVTCVIVSTPTPSHGMLIKMALEHGKHVFAEKPLTCDSRDVPALFEAAAARGLLLHTAYNRRHDPAIRRALCELRLTQNKGKVLGATLVSRDFPYPTAAYLATSGNLFKDCVVHDLDYLTWLLDDDVTAIRATASSSGDARACGMWEYSHVQLSLKSGAVATLINARVAPSYDHRLDIYCEQGAVQVRNPNESAVGVSFAERFADSYHSQLAAFVDGVHAWAKGEPAVPNMSLERTLLLARLVDACERSVKLGQTVEIEDALASAPIVLPPAPCKGENGRTINDAVPPGSVSMPMGGAPPVPYPIDVTRTFHVTPPVNVTPAVDDKPPADATLPLDVSPPAELRTYDGTTAARVKQLYAQMRRNQCVEHVMRMRTKYVGPGALGSVRMSVWKAFDLLSTFVDVSDPDVTLPNHIHAYQTAEGLRAMRAPDWLQLTGLLHDLGKMIYLRGCDEDGTSMAQQWSIVGDTWVVGCAMPDALVFPELNAANRDGQHPERQSELGIYERGCGLDAVMCAFGHDEYLYEVLRQNEGVTLPPEALYIIRHHSLYPWHDGGCYELFENAHDRSMKGWVKLFNQHDLYTKRDMLYSASELVELRAYYSTLANKYLPAELNW